MRRSLVRALGYIREPRAVPTLQALARARGELGDDACYALARIRDEAAIGALGRLLTGADDKRRELLEFLLSDGFVEQEATLGRPIDLRNGLPVPSSLRSRSEHMCTSRGSPTAGAPLVVARGTVGVTAGDLAGARRKVARGRGRCHAPREREPRAATRAAPTKTSCRARARPST